MIEMLTLSRLFRACYIYAANQRTPWHSGSNFSSQWTEDTAKQSYFLMTHTVSTDPDLPLSWHRHGLSCTPSGLPSCLTLPRAPWPSSSWVWTWACDRRSWTRWAWLPGGHTAPGRPWVCPYRWSPGQSCQTGRGTGTPHLLQLHRRFHPPWSSLTQGCQGPSPPRQGSLVPAPALEHTQTVYWGALTPGLRHLHSVSERKRNTLSDS